MSYLGIDVGTQGARALIVGQDGTVLAEASLPFAQAEVPGLPPGWHEQDPRAWHEAVVSAVATATVDLRRAGGPPVEALSVTSTSGTLCLVDERGEPLGPAIMYSDTRSADLAAQVQNAGAGLAERLGYGFNASFALSKLTWVSRVQPERLARARWCLSPADLVAGWFTGEWGTSDWTNALKMGYDLLDLRWPTFISEGLGLPAGLLPRVVAPGTPIGDVSAQAAERMGLPVGAQVVAGSTDGVAAQLASGAVSPGDWNSTLGTTLVIKGVSRSLLRDAQGRIYCHRHPEGYWLPGGASSTGAECLAMRFGQDLDALNRAALAHTPSGVVVYPLVRRGERFPFCRPEATGFTLGQASGRECLFSAHLEGIAYVERLAYDVLRDLGASVGDTIHVAGGGIQSEAGLQVRADVLNRRLVAPAVPSAAMGAAILAAYGHSQDGLSAVARRMVRHTREVTPRPGYHGMYADGYDRFVRACEERGYLP